MTTKKLTPRHAAFVAEYLKDKNATQAAVRAGYSEASAKYTAREVLKMPHVKAAIARALKEQEKRTHVDSDRVLLEIERLAMFDPASLTAVKGPDDIAALPESVRRAIVGWSWDRNGNFTVKTVKEGALGMLAKHFGLFEADNRQKAELTLKKGASDLTDEELMVIALGKTAKPT